jgi:hypothetical protein
MTTQNKSTTAGTTEFGHVLFDAGRTVRSDLTLIDHAIESGAFESNEAFVNHIILFIIIIVIVIHSSCCCFLLFNSFCV